MKFARVDLSKNNCNVELAYRLLDPVPIEEVLHIYKEYCLYKKFESVIPMVPGRFLLKNTEVFGYYDQGQFIAWSMYRIWDSENVVIDHHAWDYKNPQLNIGIRSLQTECAIYRDRGFEFMYFESIEPYMTKLQGFEILGPI